MKGIAALRCIQKRDVRASRPPTMTRHSIQRMMTTDIAHASRYKPAAKERIAMEALAAATALKKMYVLTAKVTCIVYCAKKNGEK